MEINLDASTYEGEVLKSDVPVLVDFWAEWCSHCQPLGPQLADEFAGKVKVCKVNVDSESSLAAQNAIVSIPTVILFVDGKPVKKLVGAHSLDDYADVIEQFI